MESNKCDGSISLIWLCVDGHSGILLSKTLNELLKVTAMWPSVPVIAVITKSYAVPERNENIAAVRTAFAADRRFRQRPYDVLAVVASTYVLNDSAYAPPEGISELIELSNELMPEGIRAAEADLARFKLQRKRALSHSVVGAATAAAATVGAVPVPVADALILTPVEIAEVNALARIYGIEKNDESRRFLSSIVEVGTVSIAAKAAISALKSIPGINLGASVINAVIAGTIAAALGEGSIYAFEQIYLGNKSTADADWVKKLMEAKMSSRPVQIASSVLAQVTSGMNSTEIVKAVMALLQASSSTNDKKD